MIPTTESETPMYRVKRGDNTDRTPFTTQWYIADERGNTGMESLPRYQRRGHDRKSDAVRTMQRRIEREATATTETVGELTRADERALRQLDAGVAEYLRIGHEVTEEQAERLIAHGRVKRETRTTYLPGGRRHEFEVVA
jgi:hypothetical protein